MHASAPVGRLARLAAPVGLFALALAVRALPSRTVLTDERVFPFGNDAYYHLRRIAYSFHNFPAALDFDPYLAFPTGAKPIWPPFFDWVVALVLQPLAPPLSEGGLEQVERLSVWVPPLLGAACVVVVWALGTRHLGRGSGLVAGGILAFLSGHFWYSQIGFVDHHAAVALTTALVLFGGMELLRAPPPPRARHLAVALGSAVALCLLVWPGSLLHVAMAELALAVHLLGRTRRGEAVRFAALLALHATTSLVLLAPLGGSGAWPQWSDYTPVVLSRFQPWLFGILALWSGACALCWSRSGLGETPARRLGSAFGLGALLATGSALALPELWLGVEDGWRWLAKQDAFQAFVAESRPLLWSDGAFDPLPATLRLTPFVFALPLLLPALAWRARRDPQRDSLWLLLFWTAGLLAVTLLQRRFFNSLSVSMVLVMALCARDAASALASAAALGPRLARAAVALALLVLLLPSLATFSRHGANQLRGLRGDPLEVGPEFAARRAAVETADWLREKTPQTAGWLDASRRPDYGVLAPWPVGHVLKYTGRRPTVVDNFGDDLGPDGWLFARRSFLGREEEIAPELARRGVRYVVAQQRTEFLGTQPGPGTLLHSLYALDGSERPADPAHPERAPIQALGRHRLVYESAGLDWKQQEAPAVYKVFEVVRGARVVGRARPGAVVRASIGLRTNRRRRVVYETHAAAGADGRYALRLPYATLGAPPASRVQRFYTLRCDGAERRLRVPEQSVREGAELAGPDLCLGAGAEAATAPGAARVGGANRSS